MKDIFKPIVLILCMGVIVCVLTANPCIIFESIMSEVWFAENGHLMIEFYPYGMQDINLNSITITHGDYCESFPDSIIVSINSSPVVIDITSSVPNMEFNPVTDSIMVKYPIYMDYYGYDYLKWGNDSSANIAPPLAGQSLVHSVEWIENYWDAWTMPGDIGFLEQWVKDEHPTPGTSAYTAVSRSNIKVIVKDQNNNPVQYVPIRDKFSGKYSIYTDSQGIFTDTSTAGKYHLTMKHPQTDEVTINACYWLEPNQTKEIPISIYIDPDTPVIPIPDNLKAFPSPFNIQKTYAHQMYFQYSGTVKLAGSSYIKVYDIKGRYICKVPMAGSGIWRWDMNDSLKSGVYFARLISGNRVIKTTSFTVINSKIKNADN